MLILFYLDGQTFPINQGCVCSLSRDESKSHGDCNTRLHVGLFQRRYNGTYTQARGH